MYSQPMMSYLRDLKVSFFIRKIHVDDDDDDDDDDY